MPLLCHQQTGTVLLTAIASSTLARPIDVHPPRLVHNAKGHECYVMEPWLCRSERNQDPSRPTWDRHIACAPARLARVLVCLPQKHPGPTARCSVDDLSGIMEI